jgi:hypothetical protein
VTLEPAQLRDLINDRLVLLADPKFRPLESLQEIDAWAHWTEMLANLRQDKASFLESYGYGWALDRASYNSCFEAMLQWRLLNALSDIPSDHPALPRCSNVVVRIVPTSSARPQLRQVDEYHVIILTSGYLSAFKGFIRLWLRGCAIGEAETKHTPTTYGEYAANYFVAIQKAEAKMATSALAYVGTLLQLLENQVPLMDGESVFDEEVLKSDQWGVMFGLLGTAIDGFLLFHETAHVLAGDSTGNERAIDAEIQADRGSVSLCIIDEARRGGHGTVHLGGPMFFCVELLRLLCEEILEYKEGRHDPAGGRYPGVEELMLRSGFFGEHIRRFLGPRVHTPYLEWSDAMGLVFDTVRWALLHSVGNPVSLSQFVRGPDLGAARAQ